MRSRLLGESDFPHPTSSDNLSARLTPPQPRLVTLVETADGPRRFVIPLHCRRNEEYMPSLL